MAGSGAADRLAGIDMPPGYREYYASLSGGADEAFGHAAAAKATLADASASVEPKIAYDLADRVARMHDIDIADALRGELGRHDKERAALVMSTRIAKGEYLPEGSPLEERLGLAVRVGLAIVTEGVTVAPLQGISEVRIRKNRDGSEYLSVSIAGPMRSAGGTESAVTILIADHVRRVAGLSRYRADSFDDEAGRFVEELRIYEREAGSFQYRVTDADVVKAISNLPVELDGVDTDDAEVINHRGMARIRTDRVRGGALRVLNDGIIGRSKKLLKRIDDLYRMDGWEWLGELEGAAQTGDSKEDAAAKRMSDVLVGRSVLSVPGRLGGFRLRYGRACNTGFMAVGIHPAVAEILNHTVAAGTQIKVDMPGKGATVAFVDSVEPPTVRLRGGDVVRVRDAAHASRISGDVERILHMGDMLVSFGDFVESGARLVPSGYVEEMWEADAAGRAPPGVPSAAEALRLSRELGVPLHPRHLAYWDRITRDELRLLLSPEEASGSAVRLPAPCKPVLEKLGVPHRAAPGGGALLEGDEALVMHELLYRSPPDPGGEGPVIGLVSRASGVGLRPKFSTAIGVRIGRPEKAAPRQMRPPVHCLFPVGDRGGATRSLAKAAASPDFYTDVSNRACPGCGAPAAALRCPACGVRTAVERACPRCGAGTAERACPRCKKPTAGHSYRRFPLKEELMRAQRAAGARAREPLKGVEVLISQDRVAEPLEKGLLRQARGLTAFKDGTVRFDATNGPLTHFRPGWIGTPVARLRELGYARDAGGRELADPGQTVELMVQDVVIPAECGRYLVAACRYVDDELERLYGRPRFYNVSDPAGLVGHLVAGLAPHTSVGVVGRVIGYTETHVCFGTPSWHSAKRRDADGDADSIMLLMDAFLNSSRQYLSDRSGGLMDTPLLVQPLVVPHELQPQAHNLEVCASLPPAFYEAAARGDKAAAVGCVETLRSRLGTAGQFGGHRFTHATSSLTTSRPRSAYSTLASMLDKLDLQMRNAEMIDAVDASKTASDMLSTHLVPDMMGNLRSYARQKLRCTSCGRKYRRPPLAGRCACGRALAQTITRASVEKYLKLATRLADSYDVGEYQRCRIHALADEMELVFGRGRGDQALLTDFAAEPVRG